MKTSAELKKIAKVNLSGHWGSAIGAMLLTSLVSGVPLCTPAMNTGYSDWNARLARGEKPGAVEPLEKGFSLFGKSLWQAILVWIFTSLWSLLFVIPGIVKSFAYAMAPFILAENPGMTARESITASKNMMAGKKGKLFWLSLSFILWILLSVLTCGLAFFYVGPYMMATIGAFYNEAKQAA
jgi:uncharacterized membrane protein